MHAEKNDILQVVELKKTYGEKEVLKGVTFNIKEGDVYGLLGPNGVGKTTTLKIIVDMIKSDYGEVICNGRKKRKRTSINEMIGVSIEEPCFYENLTGLQNLMVYAALTDIHTVRIIEIMRMFDLYEARNKKVKKYSQGMKQRLTIARVFLNDPKIIILDEPTNGLDPNGIMSMRELIKKMTQEFSKTIILSSHLLSEVRSVCNRVGIMSNGVIVVEEDMKTLEEQFGDSNEAFERFFIQCTEGGYHD